MRWLGEAYPGLDHMRNPAGFLLLNCAGRSAIKRFFLTIQAQIGFTETQTESRYPRQLSFQTIEARPYRDGSPGRGCAGEDSRPGGGRR